MDINTCFATTDYIRDLALYSHLIPITATMILGLFAVFRAKDKYKAFAFFGFTSTFALWLTFDLINWTLNDYNVVATTWAPLDYINIIFFLTLLYFVLSDFLIEKLSQWANWLIILSAVIPFAITVSGNAVFEMNQPFCEMSGNEFLANYKLVLEAIVLFITLGLGAYKIIITSGAERIRILLITTAVVLFMGIFSGAEYYSTTTYIYEVTLYSLFSLPIFILLLTVAITNYGAFRLGDAAVKVLFYIFLVLAGSQFFSVTDGTDFLISAMSFGVILVMGTMLFISNEREIKLRHEKERLAQELEVTNERQEVLMHFIGHEVKGTLTKDAGVFASISEGDLGPVPETVKTLVDRALIESRTGASSVENILKASNLKKGSVTYTKAPFDLKALVTEVVEKARPIAEQKGLVLSFAADDASYQMTGDRMQINNHVLRNIIDNSINYTPSGSVAVSLKKENGKIIFAVRDTGIGITEEDKKRLFTEGGHGKDSQTVNAHSTGYTLHRETDR